MKNDVVAISNFIANSLSTSEIEKLISFLERKIEQPKKFTPSLGEILAFSSSGNYTGFLKVTRIFQNEYVCGLVCNIDGKAKEDAKLYIVHFSRCARFEKIDS